MKDEPEASVGTILSEKAIAEQLFQYDSDGSEAAEA